MGKTSGKTKKKAIKKNNNEKRKEKSTYTVEDMLRAMDLVITKKLSYEDASSQCNVPKTTLFSKVKEKSAVDAHKGFKTDLTAEQENRIANWIIEMGKKGCPVTKKTLLDSVEELVKLTGQQTSFKDGRPGRKWYDGFMKRHENLSVRTPQQLTKARASVTEEKVRLWFKSVKEYLGAKNLIDIDSSRVFNLDESAFMLNPKTEKVIVKRGSISVYKILDGDEKDSLTVLYTGSAAGEMPPPYILYYYKSRVPSNIVKRIPDDWSYCCTESGWMNGDSFFTFIKDIFHPWLIKKKIQFPVVLYVDGHSSHITLQLSDFCSENNIEVIALFPNATHILQPCDVSLFHPLKVAWKKSSDDWRSKLKTLTKEDFASVLKTATDSLDFKKIMQSGFRMTGLHPFDPDAVNYKVLDKNEFYDKKKKNHKIDAEKKLSMENLELFERSLPVGLCKKFKANLVDQGNEGLYQYWISLRKKSGIFQK